MREDVRLGLHFGSACKLYAGIGQWWDTDIATEKEDK